MLIDNGFTPEWITLQKDIRSDIQCLRDCLNAARNKFGPVPLSSDDENFWLKTVEKYDEFTNKINSKITHYNLVVPILQKQMVFISLKNEAKKALENGKDNTQVISHTKIDKTKSDTDSDFISTLISLFKS